jgi:hypothetical protein
MRITDTIKQKRLWLHFPVGFFNVLAFVVGASYGWAFLFTFALYEMSEDWRIKDQAYIDIAGWLWGFAAGILLLAARKGIPWVIFNW